jgi:tetratricopeptide (TPR) repeat protein
MNEHPDDLRHVSSCRACRERYVADNVVAFPSDRESRRRELMSTAKKLKQEKDDSAGLVARHLRSTPVEEWSRLAEEPELRNSAALEQLSEEVRRLLDREPREALAVSDVATAIAEAISGDDYPDTVLAQLRATAWKDRSNALRYLSRYPEAIEAINRAEERLAPYPALAYDRAIVRLVKAMIAHQVGDTETAYSLLRYCRAMFESFGDRERAGMAALIEANFLYDAEQYSDAAELYVHLLQDARGNLETEATMHSNLGYCAIHANDFTAANIHLSEAITRLNDLGQHATALKTQRAAGKLLIKKGHFRKGIERLNLVRAAYLAQGMVQGAGLAGLEIIEALVARGDVEEARLLARSIHSEFAAANMDRYALAALERLDSAMGIGGEEGLLHVRNVSAFISSLQMNEERAGS